MRTALTIAMTALLLGTAAAAAPPPVAPLAFTTRTLANGLRVFALPDSTTANVAIEVAYDVGGKDDPAGRSGFAHMFEHLMFKSTRNLVPEQLDRLTEDVGGSNNASTRDDYTNYFEVIPANHLERLLWAEAERMRSLVVEPGVLASERNVVEEELRQGEARPYGKLFQTYLPAVSYSTHPYARSPIGKLTDLDAATIDDIRAFHAVYYRPDNAVLVVSGNFRQADLDRWVDKYFSDIPQPNRAIPRVIVAEPPRTKPVTYTVYVPNTPLPAVAISWAIPPSRSPDDTALAVLDAILSAGESSRLYESLVYRDQIATTAGSRLDDKQMTGAIQLYAILAGGKTVAQGEAALRREVARLRDAPVTAAELDIAKNLLLTSAIRGRETAAGRASVLTQAVMVDGDPRAADRSIAALAAVTPADLQRVARTYLRDESSATIRYLPAEAAPKGVSGDTIAVASTVVTAPLVVPPGVAVVVPASAAERVAPPLPGPPVPVPIPVIVERTLPNGLKLAVATRRTVPLIGVVLVTGGGSASDRPDRFGTAGLMTTLLTKGTTTRSATRIANEIEALGSSIGGSASWDGASLAMTVKSDRLDPAMAVFADVALHPAFAKDEIDRARTQAVDDAGIALKDPRALARLVAGRVTFGDTRYGHVAAGTPASLARITRDDLVGAYAAGWRPDASTLIMTGDIDIDAAEKIATRLFGGWTAPATALPVAEAAALPAPRTVVVDLPGAAQASVIVQRPGLARSNPAYFPATVANTALGGGFTSRLNAEIRIKRGLAYGASSSVDARRGVGPIAAGTATKNPSVPEVVALIVAELKRLGTEPVPATELVVKQAVLNGGFGQQVETVGGLAGGLAGLALDGTPLSELAKFSSGVSAVTPAAITALAAPLFDPAAASIIVVGDAKQFMPAFAKTGRTVDVIPAADLDLEKASLRKAGASAAKMNK